MGTDYQPARSRGGKGGDLSGAVGTGPLGGNPEDVPHLQWDLKPTTMIVLLKSQVL